MGSLAFSQVKKERLPVYFDSNSFEIPQKEANKLTLFFSNQDIRVTSVQIEGFCDDIGTADANAVLSEARANAVADYLKSNFKLIPNKISGKGEIKLDARAIAGVEKTRMNNRRASVFIAYAIPEKSIAKTTLKTKAKDTSVLDAGYKTFDDTLGIGDKIILKNLVFKASSTAFEDDGKTDSELNKIVRYFLKNPSLNFEIQGHVCCISASFKDARNKNTGLNNLSESRAKRIYDHLSANGISKERMTHKGYGRQFPRTDVEEKENKRVEIVIRAL
jgi:outer membrane protein OmpA-like peptidoglycan-associated protein